MFQKFSWTVITELQGVIRQEVDESNEFEVQSPGCIKEERK